MESPVAVVKTPTGTMTGDGHSIMEIIPDNEQPVKRCTKCGAEKPHTTEHFRAKRNQCRECERKDALDRDRANRETRRETSRQWKRNNPEKNAACTRRWLERNPNYHAEWRAANPDKVNSACRRWRAANPKIASQCARKWRETNPDKVRKYRKENRDTGRAHLLRRRARESSLSSTLTVEDWNAAIEAFNGRCAVCGRPPGLWHTIAADHWIPLSSNRTDNPGTAPHNIVPLCHGVDGCNNSKGNRDAGEWLASKYGDRKGRSIQKRIEAWLATRRA